MHACNLLFENKTSCALMVSTSLGSSQFTYSSPPQLRTEKPNHCHHFMLYTHRHTAVSSPFPLLSLGNYHSSPRRSTSTLPQSRRTTTTTTATATTTTTSTTTTATTTTAATTTATTAPAILHAPRAKAAHVARADGVSRLSVPLLAAEAEFLVLLHALRVGLLLSLIATAAVLTTRSLLVRAQLALHAHVEEVGFRCAHVVGGFLTFYGKGFSGLVMGTKKGRPLLCLFLLCCLRELLGEREGGRRVGGIR